MLANFFSGRRKLRNVSSDLAVGHFEVEEIEPRTRSPGAAMWAHAYLTIAHCNVPRKHSAA